MRPIRVLIADRFRIISGGVSKLLSDAGDFEVVEAVNLGEAARAAAEHFFDVALIDGELPPFGGAAAAGHLADSCRHTFVWSFGPSSNAPAPVRDGHRGAPSKDMAPDELVTLLRELIRGPRPTDRLSRLESRADSLAPASGEGVLLARRGRLSLVPVSGADGEPISTVPAGLRSCEEESG